MSVRSCKRAICAAMSRRTQISPASRLARDGRSRSERPVDLDRERKQALFHVLPPAQIMRERERAGWDVRRWRGHGRRRSESSETSDGHHVSLTLLASWTSSWKALPVNLKPSKWDRSHRQRSASRSTAKTRSARTHRSSSRRCPSWPPPTFKTFLMRFPRGRPTRSALPLPARPDHDIRLTARQVTRAPLPEEMWDQIVAECSEEDWLQLCLVSFAMLQRTARHLYRSVLLYSPSHLEKLFCSRVSLLCSHGSALPDSAS